MRLIVNLFLSFGLLSALTLFAENIPVDKELVRVLRAEIEYKPIPGDLSKIALTLTLQNKGRKLVCTNVSLGFPRDLVWSPKDLDPLSGDGIPEEKLGGGRYVPVLLAPKSTVKLEAVVPATDALLHRKAHLTFKIMISAFRPGPDGKPVDYHLYGFFLVGEANPSPVTTSP